MDEVRGLSAEDVLADRSHKKGAWMGTIRAITQWHPNPKNKGPGCHSWAKLFIHGPDETRTRDLRRHRTTPKQCHQRFQVLAWTNPVKPGQKVASVASSGKQIELSAPYRLRPDVRLSVDLLYTVRSRRYVPFRT